MSVSCTIPCVFLLVKSPKKIFGDKGKHARAAVSANSLPLGVAVEVDAIFELK